MSYSEWWCLFHGCTYGHCPRGCEKPQPFAHDGRLWCGKHWHDDGELVEMACTPDACD